MSHTPLSWLSHNCGLEGHPNWRLRMKEATWQWLVREHLVGSDVHWEHRQAKGNGPTERACNYLPVVIDERIGTGIICLEQQAMSHWETLRADFWATP